MLTSLISNNALYLDPSTTTVIITSISGVAVAVGAAVVIFLRKAKKKVAKTLHLDENAHKEVEDEVTLKNTDEDDED